MPFENFTGLQESDIQFKKRPFYWVLAFGKNSIQVKKPYIKPFFTGLRESGFFIDGPLDLPHPIGQAQQFDEMEAIIMKRIRAPASAPETAMRIITKGRCIY